MKYFITALLSLLLYAVQAQQSITVSGRFREANRILRLSSQTQRLLFIKTKGNMVVPENGYFLMLSPASAKVLGTDAIAVITPNGKDYGFYTDSKKDTTLTVAQLHPDEPYVYYIVDSDINYRQTFRKNFFKNPQHNDTLLWYQINDFNSISHVREWIDALDSKDSVRVISPRGDDYGGTDELMSMRNIAIKRLHAVQILFPEIPQTDDGQTGWTKTQWQHWYDSVMNEQPPLSKDSNPNTWNRKTYFHSGFISSSLYATDTTAHRVFRLEELPNYGEYKDQQLLIFDMLDGKYYNYDIYSDKHPDAISFELLYVDSNTLYTATQYFTWHRYSYNKDSDRYEITRETKLLPDSLYKQRKLGDNIAQSYCNGKTMYMLFFVGDENNKLYYLLSFDVKTGGNIVLKPLNELLAKSNLHLSKKTMPSGIKYVDNNHADFFFCMTDKGKDDDIFYLVKTNRDFSSIKTIPITRDESSGWLLADTAAVYTIDTYGGIKIKEYDTQLAKMKNKTYHPMPNCYGYGWIATSKNGIAVYGYQHEPLAESIVKYEFDKNFERLLKQNCVYRYFPVENISSDNQEYFFYASPISGGHWLVFFKDDNTLRYAETE